jgi:putative flippase GtrA
MYQAWRGRLLSLLSRLPPERRAMLGQFMRFAVIGVLGFVWDTCIVYALAPRLGPYVAGLLSYFIVGSINWVLNRVWTYRHAVHAPPHRQLMLFLLANSVGLLINRGAYFTLVATVPVCRQYLVLPVAAGGISGMFINFFLSRRLVFR